MKHDFKTLIRYQRELVNQRRLALTELEEEHARLQSDSAQMRISLIAEQDLSREQDVGFSYAAFAQSTLAREKSLAVMMAGLDEEIDAVRDDLHEVFQTLKRYEILAEKSAERERHKENVREQDGLDEIALNQFRDRAEVGD